MQRRDIPSNIRRRTFLAGAGAGAAGVFLNPLFAAAAGAAPTRLLIIHRPCGTRPESFFPQTGDTMTFPLSPILQSFEKIKADMTILNEVTCPRDVAAPGDQHSAGLIGMMSGKKFMQIPGTDAGGDPNAKNIVAADKTIDQLLLQKVAGLQGTIPPIHSTAYRPSSVGLPCFKVMSYSGPNLPNFPESRPDQVFNKTFGNGMPAMSAAEIAKIRTQNGSVLDFVSKDLARLRGQVPQSQLPKLDAHLDGIRQLEQALAATGSNPGAMCTKPMQAALPSPPTGLTIDEAQHLAVSQNQLAIIQTAFQCDLTRVATFTFAHGNSDLRFGNMLTNFADHDGHHTLSHDTGAIAYQVRVEQFYAETLSAFLQGMKATPDGDGSLLDHTLVVYLNECCIGNTHSVENIPLLMFGGKSLKLQTGTHLKFGGRFMNDVWAAVGNAFGVPMLAFGDPMWNKGSVAGLIG
jgi:hypothetical protein